MEIVKKREFKTLNSAIGSFIVNGVFECWGLEPTDRGLTSDMTLEQIKAIKIPNKTALTPGRYRVVKYKSPRRKCWVPLIVDVHGFGYPEIHIGNKPEDTDACILLGTDRDVDFVCYSEVAITQFYAKFFAALDKDEEVWITIEG